MSRTIELDAMKDALERAANMGVYGSSAVRSGQLDAFIRHREIAERIQRDANAATRVWAHWEAINDRLAPGHHLQHLFQELQRYDLSTVRASLARDAILMAYRLSDPYLAGKSERQTLCFLSSELKCSEMRSRLSSEQWTLDLGYEPQFAQAEAKKNVDRIALLISLIEPDWKQVPTNPRLYKLRTVLKPVRDKIIAHALDDGNIKHPSVDQIREFISLTLELATEASLLFIGSASGADKTAKTAQLHADRFWDCVRG